MTLLIDTHTKESIENSLARYLNITVPELYLHIIKASENAQDDYSFNGDFFPYPTLFRSTIHQITLRFYLQTTRR